MFVIRTQIFICKSEEQMDMWFVYIKSVRNKSV